MAALLKNTPLTLLAMLHDFPCLTGHPLDISHFCDNLRSPTPVHWILQLSPCTHSLQWSSSLCVMECVFALLLIVVNYRHHQSLLKNVFHLSGFQVVFCQGGNLVWSVEGQSLKELANDVKQISFGSTSWILIFWSNQEAGSHTASKLQAFKAWVLVHRTSVS